MAHNEIDQSIKTLFLDSAVKDNVKCGKGCSFCCHTQVSVTRDEAELLSQRIIDGLDIDLEKLYLQSKSENKASEWYKLDHEARGCVFLDESGECKVYDDRPAVCRTNNVISEPVNCSTEDGQERPVRLLNTYASDMITMAFFINSKENGALPYLLFKTLEKRIDRKHNELTK
ncbi:MAG: YkgJ family cysteine cluster protein [Bacteriovoracaceae bacterium]|nr:YkgJ family cysteine cluster protein [Bacteriovoracaceae bacterium]